MKEFNGYITQIEEAIAQFKDAVQPYHNMDDARQSEAQLKSIEQTITRLQKDQTPVPAELRSLKLKLMSELEQYQSAKKAHEAYTQLITREHAKLFAIARSGNKKGDTGRTRIQPIISAGILPENVIIYGHHGNRRHEATINARGYIIQKIGGQEVVSATPSKAAGNITLGSVNGWTWWKTDFEGVEHNLAYYRNQFRKYGQKRT